MSIQYSSRSCAATESVVNNSLMATPWQRRPSLPEVLCFARSWYAARHGTGKPPNAKPFTQERCGQQRRDSWTRRESRDPPKLLHIVAIGDTTVPILPLSPLRFLAAHLFCAFAVATHAGELVVAHVAPFTGGVAVYSSQINLGASALFDAVNNAGGI